MAEYVEEHAMQLIHMTKVVRICEHNGVKWLKKLKCIVGKRDGLHCVKFLVVKKKINEETGDFHLIAIHQVDNGYKLYDSKFYKDGIILSFGDSKICDTLHEAVKIIKAILGDKNGDMQSLVDNACIAACKELNCPMHSQIGGKKHSKSKKTSKKGSKRLSKKKMSKKQWM